MAKTYRTVLKNFARIAFGALVLAALGVIFFAPGVIWGALWPETVPMVGPGDTPVGEAILVSWAILLCGWCFAVAAWHIGKSFIE